MNDCFFIYWKKWNENDNENEMIWYELEWNEMNEMIELNWMKWENIKEDREKWIKTKKKLVFVYV